MAPLADAPAAALRAVHTVLTDLDDTLTLHGRLPAIAYDALESLTQAGLRVIVITGRPAGWCDLIARIWPVAGAIAETGAIGFMREGARLKRFVFGDGAGQEALLQTAREILAAEPGGALSSDQPFRLFDVAIDHGEEVPKLSPEAVARIVARFKAAGAHVGVSSVHVNAWRGDYDKAVGAERFLREGFGIALKAEKERVLFAGDSINDASLFACLSLTVGVANVRRYVDQLPVPPAYVTKGEGGEGFAELAAAILEARS